jgi:hypothetical protein
MYIKGRYSKTNSINDIEYKDFTLEEIQRFLQDGNHRGFMSLSGFTINGRQVFASGLTLWDAQHAPIEKDGKLVVPTYFRRSVLGDLFGQGDPDESIQVEAIVDPNDPLLFITISGNHSDEGNKRIMYP